MTTNALPEAPEQGPTGSILDSLMRVKPAAERIGFSERWLRDGVNHRGFPHYRFGQTIAFDEDQLVQILELHRQEAVAPRPARRERPYRRRSSA